MHDVALVRRGTRKLSTDIIPVFGCHNTAVRCVNPSDSKGNYSATSNNTKLVHWPLMGGLLHLVQRGGAWAGCGPPRPLLAVPNVTGHPSTASVPITVLFYSYLIFPLSPGYELEELTSILMAKRKLTVSLLILVCSAVMFFISTHH